MLKYVRLRHPNDFDMIVFSGPPVTHAQLAERHAVDGYKALSAGFVQFGPAGLITTVGQSDSLKLTPLPDDAQRIYLLYAHTTAPLVGTATTATPV